MKHQPPTQLWINKGATVTNEGREYVVLRIVDLNQVLARDTESGDEVLLKFGDLGPPRVVREFETTPKAELELLDVPDELWEIAQTRRQLIDPLLGSYYQHAQALGD